MDAIRAVEASPKREPTLSRPRVEAYRSLAEAAPLAARLDAINRASRRPSPFDTFAYLEAFQAHDEFREPGQETLLLVAFDGDQPVGYLPLRRVPERLWGFPYHSIRFLMTHDNDRPRAVARPEDEERCAEAFYRHLFEVDRGFSLLVLNEQDTASKLLAPPASIDLSRHYVRRFANNPNATLALPYRSFDEYLKRLRAHHPSRQRTFERRLRRLFEAGKIELVRSADPASLRALFELYLDLERRSWKANADGHIGRHPERIAFFRRLLEPDQPMAMAVGLLLLGGLPVAGWVTGTFAEVLYLFEEAFDEAYRPLAPGNAMMALLVRDGIDRSCRALNMLGNYAYYKQQWLATITETEAVQIFRRGSPVHLKALAGEALRRTRPPVTQRDVDFNLERKADKGAALPPQRDEERARALTTLRALELEGAKLERLGGEALARAMSVAREGRASEAS
jgi:hypothetical protein